MFNYKQNIPRFYPYYNNMASSLVTDDLHIWKAYANTEARSKAADREERYTDIQQFLIVNKLSYCEMMW